MIPKFVKPFIRFAYYNNERKKVFREIIIRKQQNVLLKKQYSKDIQKLIVFIVDGAQWSTGEDTINGGILSIASIYEETVKLKSIHKSEVIMVTDVECHLLQKHTQFPNTINVYRFAQLTHFTSVKSVLVHVPEYRMNMMLASDLRQMFSYLSKNQIHFNVLNQRFDLMPSPDLIESLMAQNFIVTQTTAHEQYSTQEMRDKYQIPVHKLSVYATPERYSFKKFDEKENLILISPDKGRLKDEILNKLQLELPDYRVQIIQGFTYTKYLKSIEKAKFIITFGEGLDFYFIESVFSGGVAFAEFNTDFFTSNFKFIEGVFESYEEMFEQIVNKINSIDSLDSYSKINEQQFAACNMIYDKKFYRENLVNFYNKKYLFP